MKNFLIAITIFTLVSCSDSRAKDIEMLVDLEMQYGDITRFEAECFINIWSDAIEDDDLWDWMVAEATSPSITAYESENPTRYEVEFGIVVVSSLEQIRDECGFDLMEVYNTRS
tara:strand:+ start:508 stop:849 length:342 start_codon:yes stop_codon:yes gene_type:complete